MIRPTLAMKATNGLRVSRRPRGNTPNLCKVSKDWSTLLARHRLARRTAFEFRSPQKHEILFLSTTSLPSLPGICGATLRATASPSFLHCLPSVRLQTSRVSETSQRSTLVSPPNACQKPPLTIVLLRTTSVLLHLQLTRVIYRHRCRHLSVHTATLHFLLNRTNKHTSRFTIVTRYQLTTVVFLFINSS